MYNKVGTFISENTAVEMNIMRNLPAFTQDQFWSLGIVIVSVCAFVCMSLVTHSS